MNPTKEEAKELINDFIRETFTHGGELPLTDCTVIRSVSKDFTEFKDYTFKGLLKIAYDLQDYNDE